MIRTVLTLRMAPERVAEVVELYRRQDILQHSLDLTEALSSELSIATSGSGVVMVTAVDRLNALLDGASVGSGATFSIIQSVSKD